MLGVSGTTDRAAVSQDRTNERQARASRRKERQKRKEKLRTEEGIETGVIKSIVRGNASATMMMANAPTSSEGDPPTYREATVSAESENWLH